MTQESRESAGRDFSGDAAPAVCVGEVTEYVGESAEKDGEVAEKVGEVAEAEKVGEVTEVVRKDESAAVS